MFLYRRNKRFWIGYSENGKKKARPLHKYLNLRFAVTEKTTAQQLLAKIRLREISESLGIPIESDMTVEEFYLEYRRFCEKNKASSTVESDNYRLRRWLKFLEDQNITSLHRITKSLVNQFIGEFNCSNSTINRHISLIRASLRRGVRQGYLKENPLKDFSRLKENRPFKPAEIHPEDMRKLLSVSDPKFQLFIRIVYFTLARKSEVLNLIWEDVNLKNRTILFRQTKTKVPRVIPIADELYNAFLSHREARHDTNQRLFDWKVEYVTRKFQRLRDRLDLKIDGIHKFRHARASELLRQGANPRDIQEMLGHKSSKTTMEIYARSSLLGLRKTVNL